MKSYLLLLVVFLFAFMQAKPYKEELLLVLEVSRHGARSSNKIYNFTQDPEQNFKNYSELTNLGRKQHFELG
jgi:hypothetical protein